MTLRRWAFTAAALVSLAIVVQSGDPARILAALLRVLGHLA
jgi:hypothetical protein